MKKVIITVVGKDTVGILAKTCTYLAKANINILDISQTVVSGYFNMMMIVDGSGCRKPFEDVAAELGDSGFLLFFCVFLAGGSTQSHASDNRNAD